MVVLEGKPVTELLGMKVSNMRTRKAKRHKWLKSNTRGTELLEMSWFNQMKNVHYMYHIQLLPSNISMHLHANHLPTRRIFYSNLYLFLQHTVHLDLYKMSLECHLLLALRVTVTCKVRQGSERVLIQGHYSHQQNLHCHDGGPNSSQKQAIITDYISKWMTIVWNKTHRTVVFFMNTLNKAVWIRHVFKLCIFCHSWSQIIRILLHYHLHQLAKCEIVPHVYSPSKDISAKQHDLLLRRQKPQTGCVVCTQYSVRLQVALCDSATSRNCEWVGYWSFYTHPKLSSIATQLPHETYYSQHSLKI